jgi:hypothetical protein
VINTQTMQSGEERIIVDALRELSGERLDRQAEPVAVLPA